MMSGCGRKRARRGWRRASEPSQSRTERPEPLSARPGMAAKGMRLGWWSAATREVLTPSRWAGFGQDC